MDFEARLLNKRIIQAQEFMNDDDFVRYEESEIFLLMLNKMSYHCN